MTARSEFEGHTPGPWRVGMPVVTRGGRVWEDSPGCIGSETTHSYVVAGDGCGRPAIENPADAALLAAAPALLTERDALREQVAELAGALEALRPNHADFAGRRCECVACRNYRAALAKVRS